MKESLIASAIRNTILTYPQCDALATDGEVITYRQFGEYVDEFAGKLQASTKPGEFFGIEATRTTGSIIAMIGALIAGRPFVFIDSRDSESLNGSKISGLDINVVARTSERSQVPVLVEASTPQWDAVDERQAIAAQLAEGDPIAYAIHTSGSAGEPKCVLVRVDPLGQVIQDHVRRLAMTTQARTLQFARLTFDGCITEILWTLTSGACLVIVPEDQLRPGGMLQATLENFQITHMKTTPFALTATDPTPAMRLQHVINGGGACRQAVVGKWSKAAEFHNAYGATETTICNLLSDPLTPEECAEGVPLGRWVGEGSYHLEPLPSTSGADTDGRRVVRGELVITGECVALGYLTPTGVRRFIDESGARFYRTGDVVEERDGQLYFVERVDRQLKVRGYRIDPGEIESAACRLSGVVEAVVTAESHDGSDQAPADALVCYYLGTATPREVRAHLEAILDAYKVPSVIEQIEAMPYTRNGKVDRDALRTGRRPEPEDGAPISAAEQVLQLVRRLTGVTDATLDDNFFDIGGDSASTVILVNKLKELGWMDVGVRDVLRAENLKSLIVELSERGV